MVTLRNAVGAVIPFPPGARAIATEISLMYYAIFGWRAKPYVPEGTRAFWLTEQKDKAFLLAAAGMASVFEIVPVHLLAARRSVLAAWILTGVSVYGLVWLLGLSRSLALRPTVVGADLLAIRFGLLVQLTLPLDQIARVDRVSVGSDGVIALPRRMAPNVEISFAQAVELERLFGSRSVKRVALCLENPEEFVRSF